MSIRNTVKQALTRLPGNKPFTANTLAINEYRSELGPLSDTQINRALRDIPYVRKLTDGRYVVKGRRVPPRYLRPIADWNTFEVDITSSKTAT